MSITDAFQDIKRKRENRTKGGCVDGLLKPKDVADILSISLTTVHRLASVGRLPFLWIGGQRRFRVGDVQLVLQNGTAPAERRGRPRGLAVGRR